MSTLRDFYDIVKDIKDNNVDSMIIKDNRRGSIAKESNKGVLQFPVLCSALLSLEEASMINKALEREYVSFVRILTSIDSVTDEKDVAAYLKKIHQNYNRDNIMDTFKLTEGFKFDIPMLDTKDTLVSINTLDENMSLLIEELTGLDDGMIDDQHDELELINMGLYGENEEVDSIIDSELIKCDGNCKVYKIDGVKGAIMHNIQENYIQEIFFIKNNTKNIYSTFTTPKYRIHEHLEIDTDLTCLHESMLKLYDPGLNTDILNDKFKPENIRIIAESFGQKNKFGRVILNERMIDPESDNINDRSNNNFKNVYDNNLTDNDVKKANELIPTTLHIKTYFKSDVGDLQSIDYIIGVKTILHIIKAESIIENIVRGVKRNRTFFNFLKWRSGEISFFKDFLFTIGDIKDDVKSKYKDSLWWNALRRRKKHANVMRGINTNSQLVPNASLVVTTEEVERLKADYSIDLMNKKVVMSLMNEYFLLSIVVMDSSAEIAHIFLDGQVDCMQHSYTSLERENSNQAREVKNIMQILGKM